MHRTAWADYRSPETDCRAPFVAGFPEEAGAMRLRSRRFTPTGECGACARQVNGLTQRDWIQEQVTRGILQAFWKQTDHAVPSKAEIVEIAIRTVPHSAMDSVSAELISHVSVPPPVLVLTSEPDRSRSSRERANAVTSQSVSSRTASLRTCQPAPCDAPTLQSA